MLEPMLASLIDAPIEDPDLVYEPKYDGIRAIAEVPAGGAGVRLWSRLGNEKTTQFPEVAAALATWARKRRHGVVLDGEIVALDDQGRPLGFQALQGRIHVKEIVNARRFIPANPSRPSSPSSPVPTAFIAFDLLREGGTDLRSRALTERRAALERVFAKAGSSVLRLSEQVRGNGRALQQRALEEGWEGLIAKRASSRYQSGKRSPDWRKMKNVHEQEFVIGGWTEPRQTRSHFGALLLGVYDQEPSRPLRYVGHVGTGFNRRELDRVMALLAPLEISESPFAGKPPANERPHWVTPRLVAQVRFTEWTSEGYLRHPVYIGLRDDKLAENVRREESVAKPHVTKGTRGSIGSTGTSGSVDRTSGTPRTSGTSRTSRTSRTGRTESYSPRDIEAIVNQLEAIEATHRDGLLELPDGDRLKVTNLHKVFWPRQKYTKGDLFRYYAQVSPYVLPAIADRPLVMKRFPNGISGPPFYQHRADDVPDGVRTETVTVAERRTHVIGGSLKTLMYTTQLAAISQDPWFSRVAHPRFADYVALDLDPASGVSFDRVLDVARWIHEELDALGATGVPKTSGASGLHVYVALPPATPYEAGLLFAQIVATMVARKHPREATTERSVNARGKRVYIDCLQNILGKTLAAAYSARASDYAGVSTPLTWKEVAAGVAREAFTIKTVPARVREVGDLWKPLRSSKGVDLAKIARFVKRR